MSESLSTMSLRKLFRFPFQEPEWASRFLVGALLTLANYIVPIVPGIFVSGYILRVMRQSVEGEEPTLPAWDDWGKLTKDGLGVLAISLVYFLPAIVVMIGGMVIYFVGSFYGPLAASTSSNPEEILVMMPMIMLGSMAIQFVTMFLGMILSILGAIALPLALGQYVAHGEIRAAFRVRQWWRILKADKLGYFISWVVIVGLMGVIYFIAMLAYFTLILCCFIPILIAPVSLYILLVGAALFGQIYRDSSALGAEPVELPIELAPEQ